jgi:hypothetical protein
MEYVHAYLLIFVPVYLFFFAGLATMLMAPGRTPRSAALQAAAATIWVGSVIPVLDVVQSGWPVSSIPSAALQLAGYWAMFALPAALGVTAALWFKSRRRGPLMLSSRGRGILAALSIALTALLLADIGPGLLETWEIFSAPGNQFDERPR